ncbi:MAG: hypothetical protein BWY80_00227 [Firmicutes bacterium ADurb.Bin456]|nr:MAG: hypothetical protein BWY80_00227 [Firmicutes bacterium ADurb.Bin456]
MITITELIQMDGDTAREAAKAAGKNDLPQIVGWLAEKDKNIRDKALLLLKNRSLHSDDVYPFWDVFRKMLKSEDPGQVVAGAALIAANTRWDRGNKIDDTIEDFLSLLNDREPAMVRQCIRALHEIIHSKKHLRVTIAAGLISIDLSNFEVKEQKPLLTDILGALVVIREGLYPDEVEQYISMALAGSLLSPEDKKQIKSKMGYTIF